VFGRGGVWESWWAGLWGGGGGGVSKSGKKKGGVGVSY